LLNTNVSKLSLDRANGKEKDAMDVIHRRDDSRLKTGIGRLAWGLAMLAKRTPGMSVELWRSVGSLLVGRHSPKPEGKLFPLYCL
jgi:hypothetical protein